MRLGANTTLKLSGTVDIECADWDRFAVGATFDGHRVNLWRSIDELVDFLLAATGTWWAHAGGVYDFLAIAEVIRARGLKATLGLSQSRISSLSCGKLVLRDSWSLIPMPLDEAAKIAGTEAHKLPWQCQCGRNCGGYCKITTAPDPDVDEHVASDVRVLYAVLHAIGEHCDERGYHLRSTIGGTAWATAQAILDLPKADLPSPMWRRVYRAVMGGRNTIGRMAARGPGSHWDLASAHAASLAKTSLPVGTVAELGSRDATYALGADRPGIYQCAVTVPGMDLPPLPWRVGGKIAYPVGSFHGSWALPELHAAIARGAVVDRVYTACVWESEAVIFDELIESWFAVRTEVGKRTPLGMWQAGIMRALTGKFAESPEREIVQMNPDEWVVCMARGECAERCTGRCGAFRSIDKWGQIIARPIYRASPAGHLQWHCYLTARTRTDLLDGMDRVGADRLVYTATDSIWSLGRMAPGSRGRALGDWDYKHAWRSWECPAPGHYAFTRAGQDEIVAAGASKLTRAEWDRGSAERDRGVSKLTEAAREGRGLFRRRHERWTMPKREGEQVWLGDRLLDPDSGRTYPATPEVHLARIRSKRARSQRGPGVGVQEPST